MLNYSDSQAVCQTEAKPATPASVARTDGLQLVEQQMLLREEACQAWESRLVKVAMAGEMAEFIAGMADWKNFWTLTFENEKTADVTKSLFLWMVRELNKNAYGKNYTNKVGHSYFQYVAGIEKQTRDVYHLHVLADQPINYDLIHSLWGERCGFAWIDGNLRDTGKVVNYVCKYVVKGGDLEIFKRQKPLKPPKIKPLWWKDGITVEPSQGLFQVTGFSSPGTTCAALDGDIVRSQLIEEVIKK